MVQVKVEHVIVVLLGLFLLYHFMGSCGCNRVEGWLDMSFNDTRPFLTKNDSGDVEYCGLREDYLTNVKNRTSRETGKLEQAQSELSDLRANLEDQLSDWGMYNKEFSDSVTTITDASLPGTIQGQIPTLNQYGKLANKTRNDIINTITEMNKKKTIINDYTNQINSITNQYKSYSSVCSEPNRILEKYKPRIACDPLNGDIPEETSFNKMPLTSDRDHFKDKNHRKSRTWDGKNVCQIKTDQTGSSYVFAGFGERDDTYGKDAWTETKWENYSDSNLNIAPDPSPVGPFPNPPEEIPNIDGEYFNQELINTFDERLQGLAASAVALYEAEQAAARAAARGETG